jgi:hypothetical protein
MQLCSTSATQFNLIYNLHYDQKMLLKALPIQVTRVKSPFGTDSILGNTGIETT